MLNQEISLMFEKIALMLEYHANPGDGFKIRAFKNAAAVLLEISEPLEKLVKEDRIMTIPGIGQGIASKITEYIEHETMTEFKLLERTVPKDFFELVSIPTLGPKKVRMLHDHLSIETIEDLKKVLEEDKVASLPRFGAKSAQNIKEGLSIRLQNTGRRLRGDVVPFVEGLLGILRAHPDIERAVVAGSYRRGEETVGDVDILATGKNISDIAVARRIMQFFVDMPFTQKILGQGDTKSSLITKDGLQIDFRLVEEHQFGSALQYFTGSKSHNIHVRNVAKSLGLKVSEYGVFKGEDVVASETEEACYNALGLSYIPPELRTDTGEIAAASNHTIPKLIELADLRGDLHVHTNYSDGVHSLEAMVAQAQKLGYEYVAITDHSPSLKVANGLSPARLLQKKKEIDVLQEKYKINILFGTEVDILADGSIDYPDEILKEFDVVVASIHSRFNQDNTERILKAMENRYVHVIGHPSGRHISVRNPYELDYDAVFKKAVETGTVIEINAQPSRMDLIDVYMRPAIAAGCLFSIDSDAHSTEGLSLISNGVTWARRGWIQKENVVNTLPLKKMMEIFRGKRT